MEIKTDSYMVAYDSTDATLRCQGSLLLSGTTDYAPILDLLTQAAEQQSQQEEPILTLDIRELEFVNSSGINTFTKFVISIRNKKLLQLNAIGYENISWQSKLLRNLQRLMPNLGLNLK